MKKFFAMFAIAAIALTFAACGGSDEKKAAQKSEFELQAERYGKLRALYMCYDHNLYDACCDEIEQWITTSGNPDARDLMYVSYDAVYDQVYEMFDKEISMEEAMKQLGL